MGLVNRTTLQRGGGQDGINLECTPDLFLGSGFNFSVVVGFEIYHWKGTRTLNSFCNEGNQPQSREDHLQSDRKGRGGRFSKGGYEN